MSNPTFEADCPEASSLSYCVCPSGISFSIPFILSCWAAAQFLRWALQIHMPASTSALQSRCCGAPSHGTNYAPHPKFQSAWYFRFRAPQNPTPCASVRQPLFRRCSHQSKTINRSVVYPSVPCFSLSYAAQPGGQAGLPQKRVSPLP